MRSKCEECEEEGPEQTAFLAATLLHPAVACQGCNAIYQRSKTIRLDATTHLNRSSGSRVCLILRMRLTVPAPSSGIMNSRFDWPYHVCVNTSLSLQKLAEAQLDSLRRAPLS